MSRKKRKTNAKGRNKESVGSFSKLPHRIQHSPAYMALTPNGRSLLFELISLEKGQNNGGFWLSEKDAAARMGVGCPKTARKAFHELIDTGLIAMTKDAYFHVKTGGCRSRCWRLTWLFNFVDRKPASNEWQQFDTATKKVRSRIESAQTALKAYKRQYAEIRNAQGKFPDPAIISPVEQGEFPSTKISGDANPGFRGESKQGNSTPHTAVTMSNEDNSDPAVASGSMYRRYRSPLDSLVGRGKAATWSIGPFKPMVAPLPVNDNNLPLG